MVVLCLLAPLIAPFDPLQQDIAAALQGPSATHPLGTDELGRDVLSRLLYGGRVDLLVAVTAVLAPLAIGTLLGSLAGYFGGWVDTIIMRLADVVSAFPFYVLVIALVFIMGTGMWSVFVAITVVSWVPFTRLVRAEALRVRGMDFVDAAKTAGIGGPRILARHIVPNVTRSALTYAVTDASANILVIVTLSYFGLGLVPPDPDWGQMLAGGQQFLANGASHLIVFPALAIVLTSSALSLIGDGLTTGRKSR